MKKTTKLVLYLTSVLLLIINGVNGQLSGITCTGNGKIGGSVTAEIESVVTHCKESFNVINTTSNKDILITRCPLNVPVTLYLLREVVTEPTWDTALISQGAENIETVICDGQNRTVTLDVTNSPVPNLPPVTVPYTEHLTMQVYATDASSHPIDTNVQVGAGYSLKISSVFEVFIHVLSCTAAPDSTSKVTVEIYNAITTVTTNSVLGNFTETKMRTSAGMTGFRFVVSDQVFISCLVDVCSEKHCPPLTTTTAVPITPTKLEKRRRRNALQQKHKKTVTISTSFRVENLSKSGVQGMVANEGRCILIASILLAKFSLCWF